MRGQHANSPSGGKRKGGQEKEYVYLVEGNDLFSVLAGPGNTKGKTIVET